MNSSIISVIVPVFRTGRYLKKCVDSILGQSFQNFEIILVSEGIEDDDKVCREYVEQDERISLYRNSYRGLGGARNTGLDVAKGEFISFIDSDDWVEPNFLAKMLEGIFQGADIAQCGTNIVFEGKTSPFCKKRDEEYFAINRIGKIFLDNSLFGYINVGCWNKLYRKSLIEKYSLRFPEYKRNEDAYFTWAYWSVSEYMFCIPDKLYNYLRRQDSLMAKTFSQKLGEDILDHLDIAEDLYEFLLVHKLLEKRKDAFLRAYTISYFFVKDNASPLYWEIGHKIARGFLQNIDIPESNVLLRRIAKYPFREFSLNGKNSFLENIFSLKKSYNQKHKILTLCGVKLKLKIN